MIWLPLCLLIGLQVGFLAYHSEQVLELQRWAIVADLGILTLFWPIIRSPDGKWMSWVLRATGISAVLSWINQRFFSTTVVNQPGFLCAWVQRFNTRSSGMPIFEGILSLITLIVVFGFSYGVAVLPDSDNEAWVANKVSNVAQWFDSANEIIGLGEADEKGENPAKFVDAWLSVQPLNKNGQLYFRLTEWLFDRKYLPVKDDKGNIQQGKWDIKQPRDSIFHRNLRLREKLLIANELKPEDIAALMYNDKTERGKAINKTVGLILRGRDLRYADFTESLMPNIDFQPAFGKVDSKKDEETGGDSQKVNGIPTDLSYANFDRAKLFKARMNFAQLQGADLRSAKLQGADLSSAQLQGANLILAQLQGADLRSAQLQGADLRLAQLEGADLSRAQLQGANLSRRAQLQGANLWKAQLEGADLSRAQLQGAYLRESKLQGADLSRAQLQGAYLIRAQLQGADLRRAQLQGADLSKANLTHSNITDATFGKMSEQESKDLFEEMSQIIKNPRRLKALQNRLSKATKSPASLAKAQGQNIWIKEPDEIVKKVFKESKGDLAFARSETDYQNGLMGFLISLSCQDKWTASGIIGKTRKKDLPTSSFALCLLSLKDKTKKSGLAVCPGLSEISKRDIESLKRMASKTKPESNIQSTFKCETGMVN